MNSEGLRARKYTPPPQLGVLGDTVAAIDLKHLSTHGSVHRRKGLYHLYGLADAR
jgi:hypothetical protein